MSRSLSQLARQALFAPETGEAFLVLLTISHPGLEQPIRITSDAVDTQSRGLGFIAFPFDIVIPDDTEGASPRARVTIDNIDRTIVAAVRSMNAPATVLIEIVRAADADTVEAAFPDFRLINVSYDARTVSGDLAIEDFTAEPWPASRFSPAGFPGLF